jgi:Holliday junction DNA helicase RuvA
MIAGLNGTVRGKGADHALIAVGGITLRVFVPAMDLAELREGDTAALQTHLIVREDDLQLYGFAGARGRELFEALISVSGVGPRVALAILSTLNADALGVAIATGDAAALSRAQGVGKRIAERVIVELRPQMEIEIEAAPSQGAASAGAGDPALDWLVSLGFSSVEARQALSVERGDDLPTGERVKRALQRMGQT